MLYYYQFSDACRWPPPDLAPHSPYFHSAISLRPFSLFSPCIAHLFPRLKLNLFYESCLPQTAGTNGTLVRADVGTLDIVFGKITDDVMMMMMMIFVLIGFSFSLVSLTFHLSRLLVSFRMYATQYHVTYHFLSCFIVR